MSTPVLHYFKGRGKAESVRLMMAACGVEWTDGPFHVEPSQIAKMRQNGDLLFDQLPLLEIDGMKLVQSMAMVRYIESKHNLRSSDPENQARIEMLSEGCRDFINAYMPRGFIDDEKYRAGVTKANARYMPVYEKELGTNDFLVANKMSMADVLLFEILLQVEEVTPDCLEKYPKLKAFYSRMGELPNLKKYLTSAQRFPANHAQYVAEVKLALGW